MVFHGENMTNFSKFDIFYAFIPDAYVSQSPIRLHAIIKTNIYKKYEIGQYLTEFDIIYQ